MQYEHVTTDTKRTMLTQRIAQLEQEHYGLVLNKIANSGDNGTPAPHFDEQLRRTETALDNLRATLKELNGPQPGLPPARDPSA